MRVRLLTIGNSRMVLLPTTILDELGIRDEAEVCWDGTRLVVEPVKQLRRHWFDGYCVTGEEEAYEGSTSVDEDEWQW